jgi:hypothetical protein
VSYIHIVDNPDDCVYVVEPVESDFLNFLVQFNSKNRRFL